MRWILKLMMMLPEFLLIKMSGGSAITLQGRTLSPRFQLLCAQLAGNPGMNESGVIAARKQYRASAALLGEPEIQMANVYDETLTVATGSILLRRYVPHNNNGAAVVYYHGGGWVIGDVLAYDGCCRLIAEQMSCQVISVDYRLAPEHPFPAASDDAISAFHLVQEKASDWGIDSLRIAVMGDSAGGHLSAVVCQHQLQHKLSQPKLQILVYPVTDLSQQAESYRVFGENFVLTKTLMEWFRDSYLANTHEAENPTASPLLTENLNGLCSAIVHTAGFDPLHDEGEAYAKQMQSADVPVNYHRFDHLPHGYITMTGMIPEAKTAVLHVCKQAKAALA